MSESPQGWDAFISHAFEDKGFVEPLAEALSSLGARIWYDRFTLRLGDSLSKSIDHGLANSRFGLVIISPSFIGKAWPERELAGLVSQEVARRGSILPIWHDVDHETILAFSPTLADRLAIRTSEGSAVDIAIRILQVIRSDLYAAHPRAELAKRASGEALRELQDELDTLRERLEEFQCPYCEAVLVERMQAPVDGEEKHWDEIVTYECGHQEFAGDVRHPCPAHPRFPAFDEYELKVLEFEKGSGEWMCQALPRTRAARMLDLGAARGSSRAAAIEQMKEKYRGYAPAQLHPS